MSTSAEQVYDKLNTISHTKQAIHDAIEDKGVEVPDGASFYEYASLISAIETGGGFGFIAGGEDIGGSTVDNTAEYPVVTATLNGSATEMCTTSVDVPFGCYSVIVRIKVSKTGTSGNVATMKASYNGSTLTTVDIPHSLFTEANKWECVAFGVDFFGVNQENKELVVTVSTSSSASSGTVVSVDYIRIIPSGTALGGVG